MIKVNDVKGMDYYGEYGRLEVYSNGEDIVLLNPESEIIFKRFHKQEKKECEEVK